MMQHQRLNRQKMQQREQSAALQDLPKQLADIPTI